MKNHASKARIGKSIAPPVVAEAVNRRGRDLLASDVSDPSILRAADEAAMRLDRLDSLRKEIDRLEMAAALEQLEYDCSCNPRHTAPRDGDRQAGRCKSCGMREFLFAEAISGAILDPADRRRRSAFIRMYGDTEEVRRLRRSERHALSRARKALLRLDFLQLEACFRDLRTMRQLRAGDVPASR